MRRVELLAGVVWQSSSSRLRGAARRRETPESPEYNEIARRQTDRRDGSIDGYTATDAERGWARKVSGHPQPIVDPQPIKERQGRAPDVLSSSKNVADSEPGTSSLATLIYIIGLRRTPGRPLPLPPRRGAASGKTGSRRNRESKQKNA